MMPCRKACRTRPRYISSICSRPDWSMPATATNTSWYPAACTADIASATVPTSVTSRITCRRPLKPSAPASCRCASIVGLSPASIAAKPPCAGAATRSRS